MFALIFNLLSPFKNQIMYLILVCTLIGGAWLWHLADKASAVYDTKIERDTYWTLYIKDAPVDTLKDTTIVKIIKKDTSGTGKAIALLAEKIHAAYKNKIDSLITLSLSTDSLKQILLTYIIPVTDSSWISDAGRLHTSYFPINKLFTYNLTDRPPLEKEIITTTIAKIVPEPFPSMYLEVLITPTVMDSYVGVGYRKNNFLFGLDYKIAGPHIQYNENNINLKIGVFF